MAKEKKATVKRSEDIKLKIKKLNLRRMSPARKIEQRKQNRTEQSKNHDFKRK